MAQNMMLVTMRRWSQSEYVTIVQRLPIHQFTHQPGPLATHAVNPGDWFGASDTPKGHPCCHPYCEPVPQTPSSWRSLVTPSSTCCSTTHLSAWQPPRGWPPPPLTQPIPTTPREVPRAEVLQAAPGGWQLPGAQLPRTVPLRSQHPRRRQRRPRAGCTRCCRKIYSR